MNDSKAEDGFTLIELMVVVLIIALLIAIAIPTFLGARERAQERSMQSTLRHAQTALSTMLADGDTFDSAKSLHSYLIEIEPGITFTPNAGSRGTVWYASSVLVVGPTERQIRNVIFYGRAENDRWFCLQHVVRDGLAHPPGIYYGQLDAPPGALGFDTCVDAPDW